MRMSHRRFNTLLSILVITIGVYIALSPFIPQLLFWLRDKSPAVIAPYTGALAQESGNDAPLPIPEENRIIIPDISLNEPILESSGIGVLNNGGTWRRPNTSTPDEGGNTVIIGHRFFGSRASTFYHLDKVQVGSKVALYWEGTEKLYEVTETKVVPATEVSIEAPTDSEQLTLYTCTPLWTATNRLVVIATPLQLGDSQ